MNEVPTAKTETETPTLAYQAKRGRGTTNFQELGLLGVIVMLFILLSIFGKIYAEGRIANNFLNLDNLLNGVATESAMFAIMAIGMTAVIISGGIDISVGSIVGLAAVMTAKTLQNYVRVDPGDIHHVLWEANPFIVWTVAICVPLGVGLLCGLFNGLLIVYLRLHPFVVTLGTMAIFRWAANLPDKKSFPTQGHAIPRSFADAMDYNFNCNLRLMPILITILVVVVGWLYLSRMVWGRETYAVGGNEEAARYSGLNVGMIKLRTYTLMGLASGVAAFVYVGRFNTAQTMVGQTFELTVIAAAVIGGASLIGGRGTALGALLGALILSLIQNGISVVHLGEEHRLGVVGAAIIIAAALDQLSAVLRQRRLMASSRHST